jgi:hypothetical protein
MSIQLRRILYISFILLFIIITTLVITYANGYSFSLSNGRLVRTGTFVFNSKPSGATILLNGQKVLTGQFFGAKNPATTPAKIKNLKPGEYQITFQLAGYHDWSKKLSIKPGDSTFAETVNLFSTDLPVLKLNSEVRKIVVNQQRNLALLSLKNSTILFDLTNNVVSLSFSTSSENMSFGNNDSFIQIGKTIFGLATATPLYSLDKLVGALNSPSQLSMTEPAVYYINHQQLIKLNLIDLKSTTLATTSEDATIFRHGTHFGTLIQDGTSAKLQLDGQTNIDLPLGHYEIKESYTEPLELLNQTDHKYYLVDLKQAKISDALDSVNTLDSYYLGDQVVTNDHEIYNYNPSNKSSRLLVRLSDRVAQAYMHSSKNYIFFISDNKIASLELDDREQRNILDLYNFDKINTTYFDHDKSLLYVAGTFRGQPGMYLVSL